MLDDALGFTMLDAASTWATTLCNIGQWGGNFHSMIPPLHCALV